MDRNLETLATLKNTLVQHAVAFGPKLLVALAMMAVGVFVSRSVAGVALKGLQRFELEPPVRDLLVKVVRTVVLALFAVMALQNLGVELLPLIAGVGVAGAGVALALQGVLGNAAAGLTLIFTKPFRVGEYIKIVGVEGVVENIQLFSTTLSHGDRSRVVIPNRKLVGEILHNHGVTRQLDVKVVVPYGTDLTAALAVARDVVRANPRVLAEFEPGIGVDALTDGGVQLAVRPWTGVADSGPATGELQKALVEALLSAGVRLPAQARELRAVS
ncbi:MAG: hypothetical protein RL653_1316 [Pseudomonadota bacterium]